LYGGFVLLCYSNSISIFARYCIAFRFQKGRRMILITGASGFVGAAVVRQLLQAGHEVRALVRPTSSRTNLARLPVEVARGDLRDASSLRRAMSGIRFVFHVAADYRLWARHPQEIVETNVEGTRALMDAAL